MAFVLCFLHTVWFADISEDRMSTAYEPDRRLLGRLRLIVIRSNYKANHDKFKSYSNRITFYEIKSSCSQTKSPDVIRSRSKSNHDLKSAITRAYISVWELFPF